MKKIKILPWITIFLFLAGCAAGTSPARKHEKSLANPFTTRIKAESEKLGEIQKKRTGLLEKKQSKSIGVEPVMPAYDPLEDHIVSFSMVNEDLQAILYSLSRAVGINIIIDPDITEKKRLLTLNFEKVSAAVVLKEVLDIFDLYYEFDENVIRIKPFQERIFSLNFLDTEVKTSFDVGGDVLGAGDSETNSGLSGNFKVTGEGAKKGNSYDIIENTIRQVISKSGKYSLNRLSGSLYVKDTPGVIATISKLINHFKKMLSRQILIEARIIEIILSDKHQYGIDWDFLRRETAGVANSTSAAWSLGKGLVLNAARRGVTRDITINATINALRTFGDSKVISNPSIRCKHGKPAIISVGTSFTYKKSVETTSSTSSAENTDTTSVEVSTVFDGLILGVIPFIEQDGRINLLINPIKSDVDRESLKLVGTGGTGQNISLPRVNIKEFSTTIALNDGDVVVLGGLIDKRKIKVNQGVPILSSIPVIGYMFKNELWDEENRELVIILSVSVI